MMKRILFGITIQVLIVSSFTSCYDCYDCIAQGESLELPYSSGQKITFADDKGNERIYTAETSESLPPNEYCGRIGSEAYGDCDGSSGAVLKYDTLSPDIHISCYTTRFYVELSISKYIYVGNSSINIIRNDATTSDSSSTVTKMDLIKLNGLEYENVFVYEKTSVKENDCIYFVYSQTEGVLKYSIKKASEVQDWIRKSK